MSIQQTAARRTLTWALNELCDRAGRLEFASRIPEPGSGTRPSKRSIVSLCRVGDRSFDLAVLVFARRETVESVLIERKLDVHDLTWGACWQNHCAGYVTTRLDLEFLPNDPFYHLEFEISERAAARLAKMDIRPTYDLARLGELSARYYTRQDAARKLGLKLSDFDERVRSGDFPEPRKVRLFDWPQLYSMCARLHREKEADRRMSKKSQPTLCCGSGGISNGSDNRT